MKRPRVSNTTLTDLTGTRLGEYLVTARLGTGGMGVVYEGVQPVIGKKVAVKVLLPQLMADPSLVERFLAEARAVNAIRHRGIVDIFGFGELPGGALYFVMELLEGVPFDALLKREGALEPSRVLGYLEEVLDALDAVHAVGITHRDIKPSNIFLVVPQRGRPYVKLLDFGIAKLGGQLQASGEVTRVNMVLGTPNYMAPEQVRAEAVGPATDLYSLGCVLFEMLTGERPFAGSNPMDTMMMHVQDPPRRASSVRRGVGAELDALVGWMLEKEPRARPPSAHALLEHLAKLRNTSTTQPWPQRPGPESEEMTQKLRVAKPNAEQTRLRPRPGDAAAIPTVVRPAPAVVNEARIPTVVRPAPEQAERAEAPLRTEPSRAAPTAPPRSDFRTELARAAPSAPLRSEVRTELSRAAPSPAAVTTDPVRAAPSPDVIHTEPARQAPAPLEPTRSARAPSPPAWEPTTAPVDARAALAELAFSSAEPSLPVESQAPLPELGEQPPLELLDGGGAPSPSTEGSSCWRSSPSPSSRWRAARGPGPTSSFRSSRRSPSQEGACPLEAALRPSPLEPARLRRPARFQRPLLGLAPRPVGAALRPSSLRRRSRRASLRPSLRRRARCRWQACWQGWRSRQR